MTHSSGYTFLFFTLMSFSLYSDANDGSLNDTGITWSGLIPTGVSTSCNIDTKTPDTHFVNQQDCANGRDTQKEQGQRTKAGFKFVKLNKQGEKQTHNAEKWHCVLDEISGLIWEVKQANDSLHRANDKYTWYNSDRRLNGGHIGDWNARGDHCVGYTPGKPKTYCHAEQYVSRVNESGLCGFNDWRLPTRAELANLVHFGRIKPTIDTFFFPHSKDGFYWTATPASGRDKEAWAISFEYGFSSPMPRSDSRFIRLVRENQG